MFKPKLWRGCFNFVVWGLFLTLYLAWIPLANAAAGEAYRYLGGIRGELEYAEMTYITGEPVLLKGTFRQADGRTRDGNTTSNLSFSLENKEKSIKLSRNLSFVTVTEKSGRQEVQVTRLERFRETITAGKDRYTLKDFQFSRSELLDKQPAVVYKSGNWATRKVYSMNNDLARVTVETWGHNVGYQHAWGSTETAREEGMVSFSGKVAVDKKTLVPSQWSSSFHQDFTYNRSRYLEYQRNEPLSISFPGGYVDNNSNTETLRYQGSFPDLEGGIPVSSRWRKYEGNYELKSLPDKQRLPVANLLDIRGHWAEADIRKLYGLGAFGEEGDYFYPTAYFFRGQFARALVAVLDLPLTQPQQQPRLPANMNYYGSGGPVQPVPAEQKPLFADVAVTDPAYKYYRAVTEAGVMTGVGPGIFGATQALTRAEALVILVRALGLEGLAPAGLPATPFYDDWAIPPWARTSIYVAYKIGLARGDEYGYLKPNETLTRAEAAVLLNQFIRFLQEEMTADYRERVLNFN